MEAIITPETPYELDPQFPNLEGINRKERANYLIEHRLVHKVNRALYRIKSQTGMGEYVVKCTEEGKFTCTCPDHILHKCECKHILAVRQYMEEHNTRAIPMSQKSDWTKYWCGQMHEEELVRIYLRQLAEAVETPSQQTGRPRLWLNDRIFCAVMKVYGGKSSRRTQTALRDYYNMGLLNHVTSFNDVNKFMNDPASTPLLHHLIRMSALPLAELETSFSIDSSGFRTTHFGAWCDHKHGKEFKDAKGNVYKARREHHWVKCHIACGNLTHVVTDVIITEHEGDDTSDCSQFSALLDNTCGYINVKEICADKAYCSRENYAKVEQLGVVPYILFKDNVLPKSKGCGLWRQAFTNFMMHREEYMQHYNKRNNVEVTFSAIKRKIGEEIRSYNTQAIINEMLCKILAYNLSILATAFYVRDVEVKFE